MISYDYMLIVDHRRKDFWWGVFVLTAVFVIAVAQPLLDVMSNSPDFFVSRNNNASDIIVLVLMLILAPLGFFILIEGAAFLINKEFYRYTHLFFFLVLLAILFIRVLNSFMDNIFLEAAVSVALATLAILILFSSEVSLTFSRFLILSILVVPFSFMFLSPVKQLIFPKSQALAVVSPAKKTTPVFFIIFDEFRLPTILNKEGNINKNLFPNFYSFSEKSTWYPDYTTNAFFTTAAVPGILTGSRPRGSNISATLGNYPNNLFTLMKGYSVNSYEEITQLCPRDRCKNLDSDSSNTSSIQRKEELIRDIVPISGKILLPKHLAESMPEVNEGFTKFFEGGKEINVPEILKNKLDGFVYKPSTLNFLHIMLPHNPWVVTPTGDIYNKTILDRASEDGRVWDVDVNGIDFPYRRHVLQTGYADTVLGDIVNRIKEQGVWDESMIVVLGDHGVSFKGPPAHRRWPDEETFGEVANTLLMIKYPWQKKGKVSELPAQSVDVLPTILEAVQVETDYKPEGKSLLANDFPRDRSVRIDDRKNGFLEMTLPEVKEQEKAAIEQQWDRLSGNDIYSLSPYPELTGKTVEYIENKYNTRFKELEVGSDIGKWENPVPGEYPPIAILVRIKNLADNKDVMVVINGKIAGAGKSFKYENITYFGTTVNPNLFLGKNTIEFYKIES